MAADRDKTRGAGATEDRRSPGYTCPACGAADVTVTVPALDGAYCQCGACRHQWHDPRKPRAATPPAFRRKDDRPPQ